MKKIILVFILISTLLSCSNDYDDKNSIQTKSSFFNINTGNKWVYKRYYLNNSSNQLNTSNTIDSVFVTGDTLINSLSYKKIMHKEYGDIIQYPNSYSNRFEYLRIDENDHLIDHNSNVLHPGFDNQFQYIQNYYVGSQLANGLLGQATFQLEAPQNLVIEENNYLAYNFKGNFIGNTNIGIPNNTIHHICSEQIGLVKQITPYASGNGFIEDRLVYYSVN